jgi:pilus assembly protein CpaF
MHDGSRKVVSITEVQRMESDVITLQELFAFRVDATASGRTVVGTLVASGLRPTFLDKFERRGIKLPSWLAAPAAGDGHARASKVTYG